MTDSASKWDEFIFWAKELAQRPEIIQIDRQQSARLTLVLDRTKQAMIARDPDWTTFLEEALTPPVFPRELRKRSWLVRWSKEHHDEVVQALEQLWNASIDVEDRFNSFNAALRKFEGWSNALLASVLHSVLAEREFPIFRPRFARYIDNAVNRETFNLDAPIIANIGQQYQLFLNSIDEFMQAAAERGLTLENRSDAFAIMRSVVDISFKSKVPERLREQFTSYRIKAVEGTTSVGLADDDLNISTNENSGSLDPTRSAIIDAMKEFDLSLRVSPEWGNWPKPHHRWGVKHEDKIYPVKQIFFMATGKPKILFTPYEARNFLTGLGFIVEEINQLSDLRTIWWVNQGQTYLQERDGGHIYASLRSKDGGKVASWERLLDVRPQDIILHYYQSAIQAASIVTSESQDVPNPYGEDRTGNYKDGRLVHTDYFPLIKPIPLEEIPMAWRTSGSGSAFASTGKVGQGYLYRAPDHLLHRLIDKFPDIWSDEILDLAGELEPLNSEEPHTYPPLVDIVDHFETIGFRIAERTLRQYHVALKTRGFVILAGPSGTGKTWLASAYAAAVGGVHAIVPVAPNWTANEDLMGYFNPVSQLFHDTEFTRFVRRAADAHAEMGAGANPYYLVLDEMNLARVEYYFANFLSAMETRARSETGTAMMSIGGDELLTLTPNLFVIGTVNIDETTHGFADKVYDRAQLLVLDVTEEEIARHLDGSVLASDLLTIWRIVSAYKPFAFRVLDEIAAYVEAASELDVPWEAALDEQILHKILPKLNGHEVVVGEVLGKLADYLGRTFPMSQAKAASMSSDFSNHGIASYFG